MVFLLNILCGFNYKKDDSGCLLHRCLLVITQQNKKWVHEKAVKIGIKTQTYVKTKSSNVSINIKLVY